MVPKRTYKNLFKGIVWKTGKLSDCPSKTIHIDCDSLVFLFLREFLTTNYTFGDTLDVNKKRCQILGARINGLQKGVIKFVNKDVTEYVIMRFEKIFEILTIHGIKCVFITGVTDNVIDMKQTVVMEKEEKRRNTFNASLKPIFSKQITYCNVKESMRNDALFGILNDYMYTNLKQIKECVYEQLYKLKNSEWKLLQTIEPDIILGSKGEMFVMTEDFDIFLFGGSVIMKMDGEDDYKYLERKDILEYTGIDSLLNLVKISILCGTDYNIGVDGMGPVRAKKYVLNNNDSDEKGLIRDREEIVNWFYKYHADYSQEKVL